MSTRSISLVRFSFVGMLAFLAACGGKNKPIDDPAMTQSGVALGQQSTTLAEMDPEADDGTVQANVQTVGGTLQGLVGQHSAYSQSGGLARSNPADRARQTSPEEPIYWDGTELCIDIEWAAAGATVDYEVELVYGTTGSDTTMDGRYDLVYDVGVAGIAYVYTVSAVYDQVTFSNGCAVGGSIIVDYDIQLDGGLGGIGDLAGQDQSGTVTVEYLGCDDVQISG